MIAAEMIQSVLEGLPGGGVITRLYKGYCIKAAVVIALFMQFFFFLPNNGELNTKTFLFDYVRLPNDLNKSQNNRTTEVRLSSIYICFRLVSFDRLPRDTR